MRQCGIFLVSKRTTVQAAIDAGDQGIVSLGYQGSLDHAVQCITDSKLFVEEFSNTARKQFARRRASLDKVAGGTSSGDSWKKNLVGSESFDDENFKTCLLTLGALCQQTMDTRIGDLREATSMISSRV